MIDNQGCGYPTSAAGLLSSLSHTTTAESIESATTWTAPQESELEAIETLLRNSDAEKLAAELTRLGGIRSRVTSAKNTVAELVVLAAQVGDDIVTGCIAQLTAARAAHRPVP